MIRKALLARTKFRCSSRETRIVMIALGVSILGLLTGCGSEGIRVNDAMKSKLNSSRHSVKEMQKANAIDAPLKFVMRHDLGLMSPFQTATQEFVVTNRSRNSWSLSRISEVLQ
jgi:hypothetical protein